MRLAPRNSFTLKSVTPFFKVEIHEVSNQAVPNHNVSPDYKPEVLQKDRLACSDRPIDLVTRAQVTSDPVLPSTSQLKVEIKHNSDSSVGMDKEVFS